MISFFKDLKKYFTAKRHQDSLGDLIETREIPILNFKLGVKIFKDSSGVYCYELSHHFKNKNQIDFYRPGGAAMADTIEQLDYRLKTYIDQIDTDADIRKNELYD